MATQMLWKHLYVAASRFPVASSVEKELSFLRLLMILRRLRGFGAAACDIACGSDYLENTASSAITTVSVFTQIRKCLVAPCVRTVEHSRGPRGRNILRRQDHWAFARLGKH